jgi:putative hemolysin
MTAKAESWSAIFDGLVVDLRLPVIFRSAMGHLLGFKEASRLCRSVLDPESPAGAAPAERLLERMRVTYRTPDRDLEQIPRHGALILVANHPFGILEGAILAAILKQIRPDTRFLGNKILAAIPEVNEIIIPVDSDGGAASNAAGVRRALDHLGGGGCLVVFPAGRVSHFQLRARCVADSEWSTSVARIVATLSRQGVAVQVVPIFVDGSNSLLFQVAGVVNETLRTAMLVRELLNKRNRAVDVRIGSPIPARRLLAYSGPAEQTEYLRWRTYVLAKKSSFKPRTSRPLRRSPLRNPVPVDPPVDPRLMEAEIRRLSPESLLSNAGEFAGWIAHADAIPNILREIGRLREITFRGAGEGTGQSTDLDSFDRDYLHLFLWNASRREIAGAYRIAATDNVPRLYTSTLFQYDERFLKRIGPAVELGRSFIRAEYQKSFAPLLTLWKGIGAWVARHPRYKTLFGPVSISDEYQAASRDLMVAFLERRLPLKELAGMVSSRIPFRAPKASLPPIEVTMEDISEVVSDLEPGGAGVPVLLRQYLKLGGQLLGFNLDPEFSNVVDGLILVDLTKTEPKLLDRYLGRESAAEFLNYWRAQTAFGAN